MKSHITQVIQRLLRDTFSNTKELAISLIIKLSNSSNQRISLLILDDIFPQPLSSFRLVEFSAYLRQWPDALVYSTATAFSLINESRNLAEVTKEFEYKNPDLLDRIQLFSRIRSVRPKLAYLIFINNAFSMLPFLEKRGIPFIFTLYPGGGFALHNESSDTKLRRVFSSSLFRHVIVSQNITRRYLLENNFCDASDITLVYGVVMPSDKLNINTNSTRSYYGTENEILNICFVAHKYTPRGVDKGYDVFVAVAHALAQLSSHMHFHVVGNFTPDDIDVTLLQNITFYGSQKTDFFPPFYASMDIVLSPNVAFQLQPGAFDGFPTGSCVEAGLCGVALMCTDELGQNIYLQDRKDIILCTSQIEDIVGKLSYYYNHPLELQNIAKAGQLKLSELFSTQKQLQPRITLLKNFIS